MMKKLMMTAGLLWLLFAVEAAAYTVEEARVRAWIQPNGDVTVNEVFHYSFTEYEEEVGRTLYREGHSGVDDFEAYAITGPNDEPGFIQSSDLALLDYEYGDETVFTEVEGEYETIKVFYSYTLEDAVRVYDEYTDAYLPFFSDGSHHDDDINELYIDVIFPSAVSPDDYTALFADNKGEITQQDEVGVRFYTPSSPMYTNSEVHVLFPSDVMTEAETVPAPMSKEELIAQQEAKYDEADERFDTQAAIGEGIKWFNILMIIAILTSVVLMFVMKNRASGHAENVMNYSPLTILFMQHEQPAQYESLLAALYTLKEKGALTSQISGDTIAFQKSGLSVSLTQSEQFLIDELFRHHHEVKLNPPLVSEFSSNGYKKWAKLARKEFNDQFKLKKRPLLVLRILMVLMFVLLAVTHSFEGDNWFIVFGFLAFPVLLFALTFKFTYNKWLWGIAIVFNIFIGIGLTSPGIDLVFLTYGICLIVLFFLIKPLSFNVKEKELMGSISSFRLMVASEESFSINKEALDPWMIRAIEMPVIGINLKTYIPADQQLEASPLSYFVAKGVHPYELMIDRA
ncbi:hypothetical protein KP77_01850 [Jeotgalibacillus alimentarius]|uniref:DUF2207 domain-containing protein n=2 Tax=Jeotgalibacillus alimentarius TaxID=135826 RepID=A0A0C2RTN0_9BACL|nr:hypothetical protein KP77_01850 [Jeotgalibacillus alimentarius]